MSFRTHFRTLGVVALLGALMLFGCRSRLRVEVDVYTGPLVESEQTRIAKAVGTARAMRDVALRVAGQQYRRADKGLPAFYLGRDQDDDHAAWPHDRRRGAFDFDFLGAPNADYVVMDSKSNLRPNEKLTAKVYVNRHASLGQLFASLGQYYEYLNVVGLYGDYRNAVEPTERGRDSIDRGKDVRRKLFAVLNSFSDACGAIARYVGLKEIPMLFG